MKKNVLYIDIQTLSKKSLREIVGGSTGCADGNTDGFNTGYDDGYDAGLGD